MAQEQHALSMKTSKSKLRGTRHKLETIASSSCQLVSALAGLNQNISGLRAQIQACHAEMIGAMSRIAAALEARNASLARR